jgi:hypothetical protein
MTSGGAGASAQLAVADNLKMLPVLVLALLKNVGWLWLWVDADADGVFLFCRSE